MKKPAPGLSIEEQPESIVLRMCLWAEARGEGAYGMLAVAWAIRNRAEKMKRDVKAVILQPWWFSSFNENDPNRKLLLDAHEQYRATWAAADAVSELFEKGITTDPTHGSTHYYNPMVATPKWGRGHKDWDERAVIGGHVFGVCP